MTPEEKEEVFVFLDGLRETGVTNMYGATPYITVTFDIRTPQARELLKEWMKTFSQRHKEGG